MGRFGSVHPQRLERWTHSSMDKFIRQHWQAHFIHSSLLVWWNLNRYFNIYIYIYIKLSVRSDPTWYFYHYKKFLYERNNQIISYCTRLLFLGLTELKTCLLFEICKIVAKHFWGILSPNLWFSFKLSMLPLKFNWTTYLLLIKVCLYYYIILYYWS